VETQHFFVLVVDGLKAGRHDGNPTSVGLA
jgi:hypothetical protein